MTSQDLPLSRGSRWRRKAFSLVSVAAIAAALTLSGGASASADDTGTAETSAVQTTETSETPAAPTSEEASPTSEEPAEEIVEDPVVDQTPESKIENQPAPDTNSDPAPEQDAVEEEAPAEETFAKLLAPEGDVQVADVVEYDVTIGDAEGDCNNPGVNQSGFWDVRIDVDPNPGFNWHVFATPDSGGGDASFYNTTGSTFVHLVLFQGGTTYAITVFTNDGTQIGSGSVTIPSCIDSPPVVTHVTPTAPTITDNGDGTGTVTIPATQPGVQYQIDGVNQGPGTYPVTGSGSVSAVPTGEDYVLDGTTTWSYSFEAPVAKKVWVCKYVGTPGTDERLKEGKNPISVAVSNGEERVPGTYFNDAQGRSYVLAYDDGGDAPDVSECPAPDGPDEDTPVSAGEVLFTDPCGTANDTYTIPTTVGVEYLVGNVVVAAGTYPGTGTVTVVARALATYTLVGESEQSGTFTNVACPPDEDTPVIPGVVLFTDPCGTANDTYTVPETTGIEYLVDGTVVVAGTYPGSGTVTVVARALPTYKLVGNAEQSGTFTDVPCEEPPLGEEQYAVAVAGDCGEVVFTNRFDQAITVLYGDRTLPGPDAQVEVGVGESVTVTTARGFLDWVAYVTVDNRFAGNGGVEVQQDCDVPPPVVPEPPVTPVPPVVYVPVPVDVTPAPVAWVTVVVQATPVVVVDAAPAVVDDVYPTASENGGEGDRFPVTPLVAAFVVLLVALIAAARRGIFATK